MSYKNTIPKRIHIPSERNMESYNWITKYEHPEDPRFGVVYRGDRISANDGDTCISCITADLLKGRVNPYCLDIGADECWWAIFCCEQNRSARVEAFEAKPAKAEFVTVLQKDYPGIRFHNKAVSNQNGVLYFTFDGSDTHSRGTEGQAVECTTLDFLLEKEPKIDLIKIDTEGHEIAILENLFPSIDKIDALIFEFTLHWYGDTWEKAFEASYGLLNCYMENFPFVYALSRRGKCNLSQIQKEEFLNFMETCFQQKLQYDLFFSRTPYTFQREFPEF